MLGLSVTSLTATSTSFCPVARPEPHEPVPPCQLGSLPWEGAPPPPVLRLEALLRAVTTALAMGSCLAKRQPSPETCTLSAACASDILVRFLIFSRRLKKFLHWKSASRSCALVPQPSLGPQPGRNPLIVCWNSPMQPYRLGVVIAVLLAPSVDSCIAVMIPMTMSRLVAFMCLPLL